MQRRTPPPKGIQVLVATSPSRNRSGRKRVCSGWLASDSWARMIEAATLVPRGRSIPPIVAGAIRWRTTIGITGCSRIDSLSTASR